MVVNDIGLWMRNLEMLLQESRNAETVVERSALYAAARALIIDVDEHIEDGQIGDPAYLAQKTTELFWHIGALLGFDIDNGLPRTQHYSSGLGALGTLNRALGTD